MSKIYTKDDIARHREQAFFAGRIAEAQSLRNSYASKTYNPHLHEAIRKRIKRYKNAIKKIHLNQEQL